MGQVPNTGGLSIVSLRWNRSTFANGSGVRLVTSPWWPKKMAEALAIRARGTIHRLPAELRTVEKVPVERISYSLCAIRTMLCLSLHEFSGSLLGPQGPSRARPYDRCNRPAQPVSVGYNESESAAHRRGGKEPGRCRRPKSLPAPRSSTTKNSGLSSSTSWTPCLAAASGGRKNPPRRPPRSATRWRTGWPEAHGLRQRDPRDLVPPAGLGPR